MLYSMHDITDCTYMILHHTEGKDLRAFWPMKQHSRFLHDFALRCCLRAAAVLHLQGSKSEAEYYTQQAGCAKMAAAKSHWVSRFMNWACLKIKVYPQKWYKLHFFIGMMMIGNLDIEVPANFQTNSLGVAWTLWCGEALNKLSDAPVSSLLAICYHNLAVIWRHAPGRADEKINGSAPIWTYQSGVFRSFWWFWLWWNFPTKGEELCRPLILSFKFPRCQSVATFDPLQKAEDENTLASFHVLGSTTSRSKRTHTVKWQIANEVKSKPESHWHSEVHTVVQHRIADAVAHVRCYWPSWCHRCWPNDQQNDMYSLFVCACIQLYQVH